MGDVVSIAGIAVLLLLLMASVRKVRAQQKVARLEADTRTDSNAAQHERSVRHRAQARAAQASAPPAGAEPSPSRSATLD
jgi:hypothetical protein